MSASNLFGRQTQEIAVKEYRNGKRRKGGLVKLQLWATLGEVLAYSGAVDCIRTMNAKGCGKCT